MKAESAGHTNPIRALQSVGQSLWLDYIRRDLITSGELARLIREDGLHGLTSNPAIFEKAITGSTEYADALKNLSGQHLTPKDVYERLAIRDIQEAADLLGPVHAATQKRDGYVSLEVSPQLARDTRSTLEEARRLWALVNRPNVMIKVPGTSEGLPAIQQLISEGVNVNITLLFAQERYVEVAEAYIAGLEQRAAQGNDLRGVASVASFFISRIDTLVDTWLAAKLKSSPANGPMIEQLLGKVAIANGKLTYRRYQQLFGSPRWHALANQGAQTQRVLWASTSTKNPAYRDVVYVEELIGPDTVNTLPPATLEAFRDHGRVRESLTENLAQAEDTMTLLAKVGISMQEVTERLLDEAIRLFAEPFEKLLNAIALQSQSVRQINHQSYSLSKEQAAAVTASIQEWRAGDKVRRLWARDATLWSGTDEAQWLGWLSITEDQTVHIDRLRDLAKEVKKEGLTHVLLLGMGGSSLCPEVLKMTFGSVSGFPELHVLDSTDPSQVAALERGIDLARTLVIVSSKSGSTLEPNIFKQYFFERIAQTIGAGKAGSRFIAITDPGSKMQHVAEKDGFRRIYYGLPSIGGRYSALSAFGMVPAAVMGIDVARFLARADEMVRACGAVVDPAENPGVVLGTVLGILARQGRDKVTLILSPGIADLGAWLEQLLAESTGKEGKGLIPIDREAVGTPDHYGSDRLFVYVRLQSETDAEQNTAVSALERSGQPVVRIELSDKYDLGREFFRWEMATAVAGSILGINAFNQPDVEASKVATRVLTEQYEQTGSLPGETPLWQGEGITLYTDDRNGSTLAQAVGNRQTLNAYMKAHLDRVHTDGYFALLAYIGRNEANERILQDIRHRIRDGKRIATCLGFGPRFLHSTGQAYKGGPESGVFLQVTCEDTIDLSIPGQKYTFGAVKAAQARGDLQVLAERGRRALRIHLGKDVRAGLAALRRAVDEALRAAG